MGEYSRFIDPTRRSTATPESIADDNGRCVFGTFDREFQRLELLKLKKPTRAPEFMKRLKLTLWEAVEVHLQNGVLLAAVCDMGVFGKTMAVFYDKRTGKVYCWDTNLKSADTRIAPNLIGGSVTEAHTPASFVRYENSFDKGKCGVRGAHKGRCLVDGREFQNGPSIEYDFTLERISKPSVVSIPFPYSDNRPLYSQKDFFRASGSLVINGETMLTDGESCAIVDDHRGYYPRRAHYDWVTTMGMHRSDGQSRWLAVNLTRNQSVDQEKYNENLLWLEGRTSLLPPVTFTRDRETADFFKNGGECRWTVRDAHDMVNVSYSIYSLNAMITHALAVKIDYYITFGRLEGYVRDEDGNKYVLDGMMGLGEDKTLLL